MSFDASTQNNSSAEYLLERRNRHLGQLLLAERAAPYVTLLAEMLRFRRNHELEPLHEDLFERLRSALGAGYGPDVFNQDLRQLQEWELIDARIEKERLRGYRDARRRKFRYRLSDEAAAFLAWLETRCQEDHDPNDADTRDLLSELISTLRETSRLFNRTGAADLDYETSRGVFYRLSRMAALTGDVSRALGDLNLRLLCFASERYDVSSARAVLEEIDRFLKQFLGRIHTLRTEILPEIDKLRQPRYAARWRACRTKMEEELRATSHLMRMRLPLVEPTLTSLHDFYAPGGNLEDICHRVNTSALTVWRKLFTHLRELERRSHRLEDLRARTSEMGMLAADDIPHDFLRTLLAPAHMRGDMHYWSETEKALPPQPRWDRHRVREDTVVRLDPKPRADGVPPQSMEETRLRALEAWMQMRGILPSDATSTHLSEGAFETYEDFPRLLEVARHGLLGQGARLERLGLKARPAPRTALVEAEGHRLSFNDLEIARRFPAQPTTGREDE